MASSCNFDCIFALAFVQPLHNTRGMPTIHRHRPAHVHIVLADRRDALVYLGTLEVVSRTVRVAEIAEALAWIAENREAARKVFEECNP